MMGKTNELAQVLDELRRCGNALIGIADSIAEVFCGNGDETESASTTQTTTPEPKAELNPVTLEQVRSVLADKSHDGHTAAIRDLLKKYGASKLSEIDPSKYAALLADTEELK